MALRRDDGVDAEDRLPTHTRAVLWHSRWSGGRSGSNRTWAHRWAQKLRRQLGRDAVLSRSQPAIFNTDQRTQFTASDYKSPL